MMALIIGVNPATNALVPKGFIYLHHHKNSTTKKGLIT